MSICLKERKSSYLRDFEKNITSCSSTGLLFTATEKERLNPESRLWKCLFPADIFDNYISLMVASPFERAKWTHFPTNPRYSEDVLCFIRPVGDGRFVARKGDFLCLYKSMTGLAGDFPLCRINVASLTKSQQRFETQGPQREYFVASKGERVRVLIGEISRNKCSWIARFLCAEFSLHGDTCISNSGPTSRGWWNGKNIPLAYVHLINNPNQEPSENFTVNILGHQFSGSYNQLIYGWDGDEESYTEIPMPPMHWGGNASYTFEEQTSVLGTRKWESIMETRKTPPYFCNPFFQNVSWAGRDTAGLLIRKGVILAVDGCCGRVFSDIIKRLSDHEDNIHFPSLEYFYVGERVFFVWTKERCLVIEW